VLAEQDPGDHKTGDHEEDVDAYVTALYARDVGVKQHDEQDGHGSEALDVGTEPPVLRCRPRFEIRPTGVAPDRHRGAHYHPGLDRSSPSGQAFISVGDLVS
jgi:hypothetical protein